MVCVKLLPIFLICGYFMIFRHGLDMIKPQFVFAVLFSASGVPTPTSKE